MLSIIALAIATLPISTAMGQDSNVESDEAGPAQEESAQEAENETQARRLYGLGSDAFDEGRFSEAAVYFLQAYETTPLPDLLFNAGAAHQRAEEDDEAILVFERYLENHQGMTHQAEVEARLEVLRRRVSESEAGGGSSTSVGTASAPSPSPSRVVPLTLVIGGAVVAAAGATFLILAGGARSTVEEASGFYSSVEADADRASTFGVVGGVALGVGAALAAVGVVLWVTGGGDDNDSEAASALRVGLNGAEWTTSW